MQKGFFFSTNEEITAENWEIPSFPKSTGLFHSRCEIKRQLWKNQNLPGCRDRTKISAGVGISEVGAGACSDRAALAVQLTFQLGSRTFHLQTLGIDCIPALPLNGRPCSGDLPNLGCTLSGRGNC